MPSTAPEFSAFAHEGESRADEKTGRYLTTREVAELVRRTPKTVSEMARRGDLPAVKVGGDWRFLRSEIDAHLKPSSDLWRKPVRPLRKAT